MSQVEEAHCLNLLPSKRTKLIHWDSCIICQGDNIESMYNATEQGINVFVEAAKIRKDDVYERIAPDIDNLVTRGISWHGNCYKAYTSKRNLWFVTKKAGHPSNEESTVLKQSSVSCDSRTSRSKVPGVDWSLCLFCQKVKHKGSKVLINVASFDACKTIRESAEARDDTRMLLNIKDVDLIAMNAKYHSACRANYVSKSNLKYHAFQEENKVDKCMYDQSFKQLLEEIGDNLTNGKAYDMATLLTRFRTILANNGITASGNYRSEKLKKRLIHHFGDSLFFHKQPDPSKPELVYSSSISLQDVINSAATASSHSGTSDPEDVSQPKRYDKSQILYQAAKILQHELHDCVGIKIQPLALDDISTDKGKEIVPKHFLDFLHWLMEDNPIPKNATSEHERRLLMIAQDILYKISNGKVKTPKHVGLAVTLHHITGSKQIVTLLNRMGHCATYEDVQVINTSMATEILAKSAAHGVVVPSNITPGTFVQFAGDNNDINEETLDGKHTTHATTIVAFQKGHSFGPRPEPIILGDHSLRRRSLELPVPQQTILECSTQGKRPAAKQFVGEVDMEWFRSPLSLKLEIERRDFAWFLLRLDPRQCFSSGTTETDVQQQAIPGWSGFNAMIYPSEIIQTTVGYCPLISGTPTEFSTVYTVLKNVQAMTRSLGQEKSVITFDLAIYTKAKELQWRFPDEFDDIIIRMGGFHIALNFLSVIGKKFQDSGLEDLLTESGLYGTSTVEALLKGKSYNRGIRAHKLLVEAFLRMQWFGFLKWLTKKREEGCQTAIDEDKLYSSLRKCKDTINGSGELVAQFNVVCEDVTAIIQLFKEFKQEFCRRSHLFSFWNSYIEMVFVLLRFVRAEREGNWSLHLAATSEMLPHFWSMDRTNYSRWIPVYLAEMNMLSENAPEVHQEFMQGNHCVSRSNQPFSQVWTDMALEQTVNRDSKTKGGIVGITQKPGALQKWFLTAHERATISSATKLMCNADESDDRVGRHKESGKQRLNRDEKDVQNLMTTVNNIMSNPFTVENADSDQVPLTNLATGLVMPSDIANRLLDSEKLGKKEMETFARERIDSNNIGFWQPIPHLKVKTFASLSKKNKVKSADEQSITVNADRDLFGRLLIISNSREIDLKEVLRYELSSVPFSLAHADGTLRKTVKSTLMTELDGLTQVLGRLPLDNGLSTAHIFDGMALVQTLQSSGARTFGELAENYFKAITFPLGKDNCSRVDVIFDRYDKADSIKEAERERRGVACGYEVKISGKQTPVPKNWQKYIRNPKNKAALQVFLCNSWTQFAQLRLMPGQQLVLAGGYEDGSVARMVIRGNSCNLSSLQSDHEEADTRILLHAKSISYDHKRVVVQSPDTDVAVLCIHEFPALPCEQLWFRTGVKDKLRYIPIHSIVDKLEENMCSLLPGFHALTGCDSTSGLCRIGKKKAWKLVKNNPAVCTGLVRLGEETPPADDTVAMCEKFICSAYTSSTKAGNTADDVRYWMFCQRKQKNEGLPPTSNSLYQHILRANYQTLVWKRCLVPQQQLPSPIGNGWKRMDGTLQPVLMTKDPAPNGLIELTTCKCGKSLCSRRSCSCKTNEMACTEACKCMSDDSCCNPFNTPSVASDEEDGDEEEIDEDEQYIFD